MAHLRDENGEILIYGDVDQCINLNQLLAAFLSLAQLSGASQTVINQYITQITNNLSTTNLTTIAQTIEQITQTTQIIQGGSRSVELVSGELQVLDGGDSGAATLSRYAGSVLLDYTDPTAPTVISDGYYLFIMRFGKVATAGDTDTWTMELDTPNAGVAQTGYGADSDVLPGAAGATMCHGDDLSAGDTIFVTLKNNNGSDPHSFQLVSMSVVKLG